MEDVPWDGYNYTSVTKTLPNDPRGRRSESPYTLKHVRSKGWGNPHLHQGTYIGPNWFDDPIFNKNEFRIVRNKAISKVEDELTLFTNLWETIYEREQAYSMLISAGKNVLLFLRNWKNPRYWKRVVKRKPSDLPSAWLMYNFGLKPLVGSINDALNILGGDIPSYMVRGTSGTKVNFHQNRVDPYDGHYLQIKGELYFSFRAYIEPEINPNKGLSNILGLTTPFSTAFSVLPWGWAVNYFVNVSDLLANYENRFPGIKIKEVWETQTFKGSSRENSYSDFFPSEGIAVNDGEIVYVKRFQSNLQKQLTYSFPKIGSNRAANLFSAIALVMKGKSK